MREWVILIPHGEPGSSFVRHDVADERQPHYFATPGSVI